MSSHIKPSLKDIEILTHCDVNRMSRAYLMARTAPEEIQITLIIGYKNPEDKSFDFGDKPENLKIHFEYYDPKDTYPTNTFRNIAFTKSSRDYIMYLDVDFIFQQDFWSEFTSSYLQHLSRENVLCPLPLFDEYKPAYLDAYEEDSLVKEETVKTHEVILANDFTANSRLFKFHEAWATFPAVEALEDMTPKMRQLRNATILPEPWGILHRDSYLFADEDFLGRVKDKQQFVCRLLDSGLKFYTMGKCVMYHLWHPDSRYDINREKENCINTLLFNQRYLHKYQNFYFQLTGEGQEEQLRALLGAFDQEIPILYCDEDQGVNDVIPMLKQRKTIISRAPFKQEYSVYGYKFILVNGKQQRDELPEVLGEEKGVLQMASNLSHYCLNMDLENVEECKKKIQNLTGWKLKAGEERVNASYNSKNISHFIEQLSAEREMNTNIL